MRRTAICARLAADVRMRRVALYFTYSLVAAQHRGCALAINHSSTKDIIMIKREVARNKKEVKVTFVQSLNGQSISVLGDFNSWDPAKGKLVKRANGTASLSVTMEPGTEVQFRYMREDGSWFNDEAADSYAPNGFGETNSVIVA